MAVNKFDLFAEQPTGQDYYDLPYNELAAGLLSKQKRYDEEAANLDAIKNAVKLDSLDPSVRPEDRIRAGEILNDIDTSYGKLISEGVDFTTPQGKQVSNQFKSKVRDYFKNNGEAWNIQKRYSDYNKRVEELSKVDGLKDDPNLLNYAIKQIGVEPLIKDKSKNLYGEVGRANVVRPVPAKEEQEFVNKALDNVNDDTLRTLGINRFQLNDFNNLYKTGQIDGITFNKVIETLAGQLPDEYKLSAQQYSNALGIKRDELDVFERNPDNSPMKDINGGYVLKNNHWGNIIKGAGRGKAFEKLDQNMGTFDDPAAKSLLEKSKAASIMFNQNTPIIDVKSPLSLKASDLDIEFQKSQLKGAARNTFLMSPTGINTQDNQDVLIDEKDPYKNLSIEKKKVADNIFKNINFDLYSKLKNGTATEAEKNKLYTDGRIFLEEISNQQVGSMFQSISPDNSYVGGKGPEGLTKSIFGDTNIKNIQGGSFGNMWFWTPEGKKISGEKFYKDFVVPQKNDGGTLLITMESNGANPLPLLTGDDNFAAAKQVSLNGQPFYMTSSQDEIVSDGKTRYNKTEISKQVNNIYKSKFTPFQEFKLGSATYQYNRDTKLYEASMPDGTFLSADGAEELRYLIIQNLENAK